MSILLFGIETGLSRLTIWLSAGLYYAAAFIFKVFLILSNGSVVSAEDYKLVLNNFYIIIGIVMLFLITFNLLKGMVNPDDQKGTSAIKKIIINFITSLIIITLLPTIFSFAFDFQTSILVKQNTIGRLFGYGSTNSNNSEENAINQVTSGANMIVNGVWTAFFNVNTDAFDDCNVTDTTSLGKCQNKVDGDDDALDDVIAEVERTGSFFKYTQFAGNITDDEVTYNFLLCLVGGFLLLYVGISYCLDMGVRLVKLAFYQIIAPIPIILRVIPEGKLSGSFGKWVQITVTCYLEVFIRIFVLYFCVYLCLAIASSDFLNHDVWQYGFMTWLFTKAFIFLGLITFMKQAPKLISDITGIDSGNMKLGIKDKLKDGGFFAAGSAAGALISSKGNPLAAIRAGKAGWKNGNFKAIGAENTRRHAWEDATGKGARVRDLLKDDIRSTFGFETVAEAAERRVRQGKLPNGKKINVQNTSGSNIQFSENEMLAKGESLEMNDTVVEKMKSTIKKNEGEMAPTETRIKELEKLQKFAKSQKALKEAYEDEADKKWKADKTSTIAYYQDKNGKIFKEQIGESRFNELTSQGVKFIDSNHNITIKRGAQIEQVSIKDDGIINAINNGDFDVTDLSYYQKANEIRDNMRKEFIAKETSDSNYNLMISTTSAFLDKLSKDPFEYQIVQMENGDIKKDADGNSVKVKGKISYNKDTKVITQEDEQEGVTEFENIGYGKWKKTKNGKSEIISSMDIATLLDDRAKNTLNAIGDDIRKENMKIQDKKETNENIQELLNQYEKAVAQELEGTSYRAYRAASDYKNKNKNN